MTPDDVVKFAAADNWFNYERFYDFVASRDDFSRYVELGVWKGHSLSYLANLVRHKPDVDIVAVDLWDDSYMLDSYRRLVPEIGYQTGHLYEIYNHNLRITETRDLVRDCHDCTYLAAKKFPNRYFDCAFIDADHSFESTFRDIVAWIPRVRDGGIIGGHDYQPDTGVVPAVHSVFDASFYTMPTCVWYVTLNAEIRTQLRGRFSEAILQGQWGRKRTAGCG